CGESFPFPYTTAETPPRPGSRARGVAPGGSASQWKPTGPDGPDGRLGPVGDAQRREDLLQVRLHRRLADPEAAGDVSIREALRQVAEHVALARRERRRRAGLGNGAERVPGNPAEKRAQERRGDDRAAVNRRADRLDELPPGRVFQEIADCP